MGRTAVIDPHSPRARGGHVAMRGVGKVFVPAAVPVQRTVEAGPYTAIPNFYPYHAYQPAYRSAYFYSPWLHEPFGLRPFNRFKRPGAAENDKVPWAPQSTYRYPWKMPTFPLVAAAKPASWGYPGFFPGVPTVTGFPGGGAPGVPHPFYPFLAPRGGMEGYWQKLDPEAREMLAKIKQQKKQADEDLEKTRKDNEKKAKELEQIVSEAQAKGAAF